MAGKQLDIIIKGVDSASPQINKIIQAVNGVGGAASDADKKTGSFWSTVAKVTGVTAAIGAVYGAFKSAGGAMQAFIDQANELDDIGDRAKGLGLTSQTLSELTYTADLAGVGASELAGAVSTLEKNLSQVARTGKGKALDAVQSLGVSFVDQNGHVKNAETLLFDYLDALSQVPDELQRTEYATRLFGNANILQFAADGGASLRQYAAEARALGVSFSQSQVDAGGAVSDSIKRVEYAWKGVKAALVTEIGPEISKVVNEVAGDIAAIPDIARSIRDTVVAAYGGNQDAQNKLNQFWEDVKNLSQVGIQSVFRIIYAGVNVGLGFVGPIVDRYVDLLFDNLGKKAPDYALLVTGKWAEALNSVLKDKLGIDVPIFGALADTELLAARSNIAKTNAELNKSRNSVEEGDTLITRAFTGASSDYRAFQQVVADAASQLRAAAIKAAASGDAITNASDSIRRHRLSNIALADLVKPPSKTEASEWDQFVAGVDNGLDTLQKKAEDVHAFGSQAITTTVQSLSGGLTDALYSAATGTKSLGKAFREFASDFFQTIAKMITQWLIFRAITSIGSAVLGGAAKTAGKIDPNAITKDGIIPTASASANQTAGFFGGLGGSSGGSSGLFQGLGYQGVKIPQLASGIGVVKGGRPYSDSVPALLEPGEGVATPEAVNRNPGAIDFMNRGGRVQPQGAGEGGGGMQFNITNHFTFTGSGTSQADARKVADTMVDAMLDKLTMSPQRRDRLRTVMRIPG